ncbi:hypothetical protein BaRGS_00017388 [Batillaria attramentaria]|uniref:Uncharacterized protein n=1 Tax=Batillaria attramentaria TaxID=370345 RepID=A0ABD0KX88_9CAEN
MKSGNSFDASTALPFSQAWLTPNGVRLQSQSRSQFPPFTPQTLKPTTHRARSFSTSPEFCPACMTMTVMVYGKFGEMTWGLSVTATAKPRSGLHVTEHVSGYERFTFFSSSKQLKS